MPRPLLLALPFILLVVPGAFSATQEPHACTTCAGQGKVVLPCDHCGGDGRGPCADCAYDLASERLERHLAIMRILDPDEAAQLEQAVLGFEVVAQKLSALKTVSVLPKTPGTLACPARCVKGVLILNGGRPCLMCDEKGHFVCRTCRGKGTTRCFRCKGKRKWEQACPECSGSGNGNDPLSRSAQDASTCPWCLGELLVCGVCDAKHRWLQLCDHCGCDGELLCKTCRGSKHMPCKKCSATGQITSIGVYGSSRRCDECKAKGVLPCTECKDGTIECTVCAGKGKGLLECQLCLTRGQAPCTGCLAGSGRAWLVTSERLETAGLFESAAAHMKVALDLERQLAHDRLETLVGDGKAKKAAKREFDRVVKRLEKRYETLLNKLE